jgi:hypothetical protein
MSLRAVGCLFAALMVSVLTFVAGADSAAAVGEDTGGVFVPVSNFRIADETLSAGQTRTFQVAGLGEVPSTGVSAVVARVAATSTTATTSSYATLWPAGTDRPSIGNMFFTSENVGRSNIAIVQVSASGKINLYNYAG